MAQKLPIVTYDTLRTVTINIGLYDWYLSLLYRYRMLQEEGFFSTVPGKNIDTSPLCSDEDDIKENVVNNYYNHHQMKPSDNNITITRGYFRELLIVECKMNQHDMYRSFKDPAAQKIEDIVDKKFPARYFRDPGFLKFKEDQIKQNSVEPQEPDLNPETEELVNQFIAIGGRQWIKGNKRRIYFTWDFIKKISNLPLSDYAKFYFDVPTMKFDGTDITEEHKLLLAQAVMTHLTQKPELRRFILVDIESDAVMVDIKASDPYDAIETHRNDEQLRDEMYVEVSSEHGTSAGGYVVYEADDNFPDDCVDVKLVRENCKKIAVFSVDTGKIDPVFIVGSDNNVNQGERVKTLMRSAYGDAFLVDDKIYLQKKLPL